MGRPAFYMRANTGLFVLVTGSRSWPHIDRIHTALEECLDSVDRLGNGTLTIMHGGAKGADTMAGNWAKQANQDKLAVDWPIVRQARWKQPCRDDPRCKPGHRRMWADGSSCPMAGYYRNEEMVREALQVRRPVLVLAFIHQKSNGTTHCADFARTNGLDVIPFEA